MIFLTFRLNLKVQISPLRNPRTSSFRYLRSNGQNIYKKKKTVKLIIMTCYTLHIYDSFMFSINVKLCEEKKEKKKVVRADDQIES